MAERTLFDMVPEIGRSFGRYHAFCHAGLNTIWVFDFRPSLESAFLAVNLDKRELFPDHQEVVSINRVLSSNFGEKRTVMEKIVARIFEKLSEMRPEVDDRECNIYCFSGPVSYMVTSKLWLDIAKAAPYLVDINVREAVLELYREEKGLRATTNPSSNPS